MNDISPIVSIIIPTCNSAKTIGRAVNSCINQTYKNIEIIVIDDGSADNTKEVLSRYSSDERFKYIYQENQERSAARNHGLDVARGEYIQFLDSDDEIYPTKIEKQINFLESHKEYFMVYCDVEYKENKSLIKTFKATERETTNKEILKRNFIVINAPLFRQNNIRFTENMNKLEDWEFWIKLVTNKKINFISEPLCAVYIEKQLSSQYIEEMIVGEILLYKKLFKIQKYRKYYFTMLFGILKRIIKLIYHKVFFKDEILKKEKF